MSWAGHRFTAVVIAGLTALIVWTHAAMTSILEQAPELNPEKTLPNAESVKLCSLGFDQLLADWYWLGFVQYVGDSQLRAVDHYPAAEKYLELIVGLDPKFTKAYWFAAFLIGSELKQPKWAAEFIERGLRANQDDWFLPFVAGINQYLYAHNDAAAAKYYRMAAKYPHAPRWLTRQAEILEARIPSYLKELNTWSNIYYSSTDPIVKARARANLVKLWTRVYESGTMSAQIKERAKHKLQELGVTVE